MYALAVELACDTAVEVLPPSSQGKRKGVRRALAAIDILRAEWEVQFGSEPDIARDTSEFHHVSRNAAFLMKLRDSDVKFQALDIPEANTLTLGVLAVLAQHERELISARTKAALAARRARGLPLGTPRDLSTYAQRASSIGRSINAAKARVSLRPVTWHAKIPRPLMSCLY